MQLQQILLNLNIPSKDIKTRLNNKQIKVNNETVSSSKIDLDIADKEGIDLGTFIFNNMNRLPSFVKFIDIKDFFGEGESNIEGMKFLSDFVLVSISKREDFLFKINNKI